MSEEMESPQPAWRPLSKTQRRVLGVLIEKAKTTPDAYPLSLNGLTTGCNQKSNRDPQLNLESWEVEEALEQLREMGATAEVHGDGRVAKYRHYAKDWLGCDGDELAIMAELLLRGSQTVGELRGRANRMGKIPDLGSLQPLLDSLQRKGLVVPLTPKGRGQVVTHGLFSEKELAQQRQQLGSAQPVQDDEEAPVQASPPSAPVVSSASAAATSSSAASGSSGGGEIAQLRAEVAQLKEELARVKKDMEDLWASIS